MLAPSQPAGMKDSMIALHHTHCPERVCAGNPPPGWGDADNPPTSPRLPSPYRRLERGRWPHSWVRSREAEVEVRTAVGPGDGISIAGGTCSEERSCRSRGSSYSCCESFCGVLQTKLGLLEFRFRILRSMFPTASSFPDQSRRSRTNSNRYGRL